MIRRLCAATLPAAHRTSHNTLALTRKGGHEPLVIGHVKNRPQRVALAVPLYEVSDTTPFAIAPKVCRPTSSTMVLVLDGGMPLAVPTR